MIMQDYKTTALVCTPGYALVLADRMEKLGIEPKGLSLRVGVFGAEPWSEAMRNEIERRLAITATDNYGISEIIGPGIAGECSCRCGLHIFEDAFIPEIIDPKTGEPLPPGSRGELVITTITKEAFPLLRYRTGDITSLDYAKCDCGRTVVRMNRTTERTDDMLIVKGVNIYPSQIREIIVASAQGEPPYQILLERRNGLDTLEISIEVTEKIFSQEMKKQRGIPGRGRQENRLNHRHCGRWSNSSNRTACPAWTGRLGRSSTGEGCRRGQGVEGSRGPGETPLPTLPESYRGASERIRIGLQQTLRHFR